MANRRGKMWKQRETLFSWAPKSLWTVTAAMKLKMLAPCKKSYDKPRQRIKEQRHQFADKGPCSQNCGFSRSHVWMWELDIKKAACWRIESPWDSKEIKPVHSKWNQSCIFTWGLILKLKHQYFGHLLQRTNSLENTLMLGKTEGKCRREQQNEMVM